MGMYTKATVTIFSASGSMCGTTIINACGYTQFELDQTRYPIRGWQAAWLNSQTMRRELKRHEAIESSTARTPW